MVRPEQQARAVWSLPSTIPTENRLVCLYVPDDIYYLKQLVGLLGRLQHWANYDRDDAKTGTVVASRWREALLLLDVLGGCQEVGLQDVRQNPLYPCLLDKTTDGVEWEQFANLRLCSPKLRIHGGEIQYSTDDGTTWVDYPNDGTLQGGQPGEQTGGDTPLGSGECKSIRVAIKANEPTLIPFRVLPGDNISITSSGGSWQFDRSTFFGWRCPSGELFAFAGCSGDVSTDPTGIIDTLKVGRLIAQYGTTGYYDVMAGATLPDGGTEQHLTLLMNDPDVSDNSGEIWAVLEVCSGEWCYDFALSDFVEWSILYGAVSGGALVQAAHFSSGGTYYLLINAEITLTGANLTKIEMGWSSDPQFNGLCCPENYIYFETGAPGNRVYRSASPPPNEDTAIWIGSASPSKVGIVVYAGLQNGSPGGGTASIPVLRFYGRGSNPFGDNNCL